MKFKSSVVAPELTDGGTKAQKGSGGFELQETWGLSLLVPTCPVGHARSCQHPSCEVGAGGEAGELEPWEVRRKWENGQEQWMTRVEGVRRGAESCVPLGCRRRWLEQ